MISRISYFRIKLFFLHVLWKSNNNNDNDNTVLCKKSYRCNRMFLVLSKIVYGSEEFYFKKFRRFANCYKNKVSKV